MSEKTPNWVPIAEVLEILNHPDFYWGTTMPDAKYIELRIDTRDNHCLVKDRYGNPLNLDTVRESISKAYLKGMNSNVARSDLHCVTTRSEQDRSLTSPAAT